MSDNLKVAKECGAVKLGEQSYYTGLEWKDCPRLVFSGDVLEAYTSRILSSQQAAHEAEIARLKEEMVECEQRGAVKALEEAAKEMQHRRFELPSEASDELLEMVGRINATSKKAG